MYMYSLVVSISCPVVHETTYIQEAKNFLRKTKSDLGMACHTPPLKKVKKQGEMPLPSLGPIPSKVKKQGEMPLPSLGPIPLKKCRI